MRVENGGGVLDLTDSLRLLKWKWLMVMVIGIVEWLCIERTVMVNGEGKKWRTVMVSVSGER